ncbi:YbjQ family protein [Actinomadura roseirufa]|uniref:YbjQ family protein n=1 Tax=Actinomadura roseirufa TaxID=2094049 RepID=UPI00104153A0|nr:heavy metal-binding domain-containing protein [Actinomadura roseirufa]
MLIVTTEGLAGYEIRSVLGEVLGTAVQTDQGRAAQQHGHPGSSATFRMTGEQPGAGLAAARREAMERLAEDARRKGANTVVGMRFDTAALGGGFEVCAYGTAVWAERAGQAQQGPQHPHPQQGHGQQGQGQHGQGQHGQLPPYGDPSPGGPPMAARNLTIGLHDRPR